MKVSSGLLRPRQDIGVDLYCETVADGRPFLHFWLQVKAGDQCKRDPSANTASCAFELEHLDYWARQPEFSLVGTEPTAEDAEFRRLLARIVEQFGEDPPGRTSSLVLFPVTLTRTI